MQLSFIAAQRRNPKKCQRALQSGTLLLHDVVTSGLLKSTLYRSLKEMSKSYNHQDPIGNHHPSNQTLQSLEQVFSPPMVFFCLGLLGRMQWMDANFVDILHRFMVVTKHSKTRFLCFFSKQNPSQLEKLSSTIWVFFQLQQLPHVFAQATLVKEDLSRYAPTQRKRDRRQLRCYRSSLRGRQERSETSWPQTGGGRVAGFLEAKQCQKKKHGQKK